MFIENLKEKLEDYDIWRYCFGLKQRRERERQTDRQIDKTGVDARARALVRV